MSDQVQALPKTEDDPAISLWNMITSPEEAYHNKNISMKYTAQDHASDGTFTHYMHETMSTTASVSVPRFASSQQNRTLIHPLLPQPNRNKCLSLGEKLKFALENGIHSNGADIFDDEDLPSPTSTLQMPIDPPQKQVAEHSLLCQIISEEQEQNDAAYMNFSCNCCVSRTESERHSPEHTFVVCADTQFGMSDGNRSWDFEMGLSRKTVQKINSMRPLPKFVCICGDLVDMHESMHVNEETTLEKCREIKYQQTRDFQEIWNELDSRIAMVCVCGNHDVGNRPNQTSISRFTKTFGDDYLSFWCNKTFNIVLNTNLFSDPSDAEDLLRDQIIWLEQQLKYATENDASHIFCFGHHPWFLYDEEEGEEDVMDLVKVVYPHNAQEFKGDYHESHFHIKRENRKVAMDLFKKYGVAANFCGHFHKNIVTKTSFGMEHIISGSLSSIIGKKSDIDYEDANGFRVVQVSEKDFSHHYFTL